MLTVCEVFVGMTHTVCKRSFHENISTNHEFSEGEAVERVVRPVSQRILQ